MGMSCYFLSQFMFIGRNPYLYRTSVFHFFSSDVYQSIHWNGNFHNSSYCENRTLKMQSLHCFQVADLPKMNWGNGIKTGSKDWEKKYKEDSIIFNLVNTVSMSGPHIPIKRQPLQHMYIGNWILIQFPTFIIPVTWT